MQAVKCLAAAAAVDDNDDDCTDSHACTEC